MFNFDKKTVYIIAGILLIFSLVGMSKAALLSLLLTLPGVIIAITFHEFAHAYAADKLGDDTPRMQGRVNLNPASHIDPIGFAMLLFAHFGWGKPVQINPRNFDKNVSMSKGEAIVSFAGPLMNFILAIVITIIYALIIKFAPVFCISKIGYSVVIPIIKSAIFINVGLGVFNLIPLPPLDGSKIFMNFMPYNIRSWILEHVYVFYIVFLIIWITGIAGYIIDPVIDIIVSGLNKLISIFI